MSNPSDSRPPSGPQGVARPDSTPHQHRRREDPEDTPVPRRERPSFWAVAEGGGTLIIACLALGGLLVAGGVAFYRLDAIERAFAGYMTSADARREKRDARETKIESDIVSLREAHEYRLKSLEDDYSAIMKSLDHIEKKLDVAASHER